MPRLPRVTARKVIRALKCAGLEFAQKGSHIYLHRWSGERWSLRVAVPFHAAKTIKPKTLKRILDQAGLSVKDLIQFL